MLPSLRRRLTVEKSRQASQRVGFLNEIRVKMVEFGEDCVVKAIDWVERERFGGTR